MIRRYTIIKMTAQHVKQVNLRAKLDKQLAHFAMLVNTVVVIQTIQVGIIQIMWGKIRVRIVPQVV